MQDLSSVYPACANLSMKAKRLERDGAIIRLKKGLYVVNPTISHAELSPFLLANHLYGPSYVSMHTALRYYGLIPEAVYTVQSLTTGVARRYQTALGAFTYIHTDPEYFSVGLTMREDAGVSVLIASPEKALCDMMVYTPGLNIRYQSSMRPFLEDDMRIDIDEVTRFNIDILEECASFSRKKIMLNQLINFIKHERNI